MATSLNLLPVPRSVSLSSGSLGLHGGLIALANDPAADLRQAGLWAQAALKTYTGSDYEIVGGTNDLALLTISLGGGSGHAQGYHLLITADGIHISGDDPAGAFYGVMTLNQLLQTQGSTLPLVEIEDYPDFPARGVMYDISRDKVPTMETLYRLIDWLASVKINQFQLYTEHTFAYRNHPKVWEHASPITAEQILALDAYCQERFIELVPNQNSFGHMYRFLKHPEYKHLAETDQKVLEWLDEVPFSLAPVDPGSIELVSSLYDELLPNFTSPLFNVGADETFDLGYGRSKAACEEKGKGQVYLEFLLQIYQRVKNHGRTMMFWGDIINQHPDLVPELPKDSIALEWGYEANHDFAGKSALFANSGIPFYVCPGTSSWTTIAGRTDNMRGNIRSAIDNGLKHGAIGVLNTAWGDRGHWQPFPVDYAGFAYGAALSWNASDEPDLAAALDTFVFADSADVMGKLVYDLGNAYQEPGVIVANGNILFWIYQMSLTQMRTRWNRWLYGDSATVLQSDGQLSEGMYATIEYIDEVMKPITRAQLDRDDADLVKREFAQAAHLMQHGARRALFEMGDKSLNKADLLAEIDGLIEEQKSLWLARNRPGGLDDSIARLLKAREEYTE